MAETVIVSDVESLPKWAQDYVSDLLNSIRQLTEQIKLVQEQLAATSKETLLLKREGTTDDYKGLVTVYTRSSLGERRIPLRDFDVIEFNVNGRMLKVFLYKVVDGYFLGVSGNDTLNVTKTVSSNLLYIQ